MLANFQRGDTIIEVLLAFTVFSMISLGVMTVMGQGSNAAQRALEITLVRQQIDAQAEAIRAAQQAQSASLVADSEWSKIAKRSVVDNSAVYTETNQCPTENWIQSSRTFIMNPTNASLVDTSNWYKDINLPSAPPYAQTVNTEGAVNAHGIWIEREYDNGTSPNSFDFTIRACWYGAGLSVPLQIKTSVRLHEPRP